MFGRLSRIDSEYCMNCPLPDGIVVTCIMLQSGRNFGLEPCGDTSAWISSAKPTTDSLSAARRRLHCVCNPVHFWPRSSGAEGDYLQRICYLDYAQHTLQSECVTCVAVAPPDMPVPGIVGALAYRLWLQSIKTMTFQMFKSTWGCWVFTRFCVGLWLSWCE